MTFLKSITLWSHQWKFLGVYSIILAAIFGPHGHSLPFSAILSMLFAGLFVADLVVKIHQEFLGNRSLIGGIDKYAVMVTGCDTGFGLHFAQRLANIGFLVYATVLFPEGLGAQKLKKCDNIVVVKVDVTKQEDVDSVVEFVAADLKVRKKTFWSLVNNAGVAIYSDIEVASMDHFQKVVGVNTFGPLRMCKAFLPMLRANKQGRIVNITSLAGRYTMPFTTAYSMSKHALNALSDGLRGEMRPWNVSVHTVQPAFYQTADNFDDQVNGTIDQYFELWEKAPESIKKSLGLRFRDDRVNGLKDICFSNARPKTKIDEVADDVIDAVAGVSPQVCYTPNAFVKSVGRVMSVLPLELLEYLIAPRVKAVPADMLEGKEQTASCVEDRPSARNQPALSSVWRYTKLAFKLFMPSSMTLIKKTVN